MATTSFSESFKYGSRLYGFFLAILFTGGGGLALGAYLAVPELLSWSSSGTAETPLIAGGLILAVLGISILVIGHFAIGYKLVTDAVNRGRVEPASDAPAGAADESTTGDTDESAPSAAATSAEQGSSESRDQPQEPAEPTPTAGEPAPQQPGQQAQQIPEEPHEPRTSQQQPQEGATAADKPAGGPDPATSTQPAGEGESATTDQSVEQPEQYQQESREQSAKDIAFGSEDTSGGGSSAQTQTEETEVAEDGFEYPADEEDFEEEVEGEPERSNVETAGNSSSDPLADSFEEK